MVESSLAKWRLARTSLNAYWLLIGALPMHSSALLCLPPWLISYEPTSVYYLLVYYYFMANHRHKRLIRLFVT